jgi:acetylglutamate kinase
VSAASPVFRDPAARFTVYKVGGPALEDAGLLEPLAGELRRAGGPVVVVHGGGRSIERLLTTLGIPSRFEEGRRVTSPEAMEVVEMVLAASVNKALAAGLTHAGLPAVGLSGRDGGLVEARLEPGLGRVGTPARVEVTPLLALWDAGYVPVVAPVSSDAQGRSVNVNADEVALAIARALDARRLVYLSDVDGVRLQDGAAAARLSLDEAERRIADGTIVGGMVLKVRVALAASAAGVPEVVVAGRARLEGRFAGTVIETGDAPAPEGAKRGLAKA